MSYTKSEVDKKNSKKIQDKGQDRVIKEISDLKQMVIGRLDIIEKGLGVDIDGNSTLLSSLNNLYQAQQGQLNDMTLAVKYDSGWVSHDIDSGTEPDKRIFSHGLGGLVSPIVKVYGKVTVAETNVGGSASYETTGITMLDLTNIDSGQSSTTKPYPVCISLPSSSPLVVVTFSGVGDTDDDPFVCWNVVANEYQYFSLESINSIRCVVVDFRN